MNDLSALLQTPLGQFGTTTVTFGHALIAVAAVFIVVLIVMAMALMRSAKQRALSELQANERARDAEARMSDILKSQSEMQGRMQTMAELFGARQSELNQSIRERLDGMTSRIGQTMTEQTKATHENLSKLQERLAVIDTAQTNIQALAGQVVELQSILSNKQTRGAFGQSRMEAIIADALPTGAFDFQFTLSNGNRPDCVVYMPNDAPPLVIDAKFPLESWHAIRDAEGDAETKAAAQRFRRDIDVHIKAIAERYFIPGETQDTAFMFVPSESIFAEIHENHEAVVQKAHRARIVLVSPSLLMLSLQVVQALLKDARMREQAHVIQSEVMRLMKDVSLLDERVRKLAGHFAMAQKDVDMILISSDKVTKRGAKIEALEFDTGHRDGQEPDESGSVEAPSGQLRLRVVDSED